MNNRLRILSIIVMTYMLAALCWWAVLLSKKSADVFQLETKLLQERFLNDANIPSVDVTTLPEYEDIHTKYNRQITMIYGEAIVFGIVLILGLYFINRAFVRELAVAEKQKNFLLSITHELKSPLTSINLILDTFKKRNLPYEKVSELSTDALKESSRLNDLFDKILMATKLGNTHQFTMTETDVSNLVESTLDKIKRIYPDVDIKSTITPNIIKTVDGEAMVSVLHNLIENAVKYTDDHKEIAVELSLVNSKMKLSVSDNGPGIPEKERSKIFDQFYRVGSEETRKSKGTGLGLYIVRKIVNAHKGKITVNSVNKKGTTFDIFI